MPNHIKDTFYEVLVSLRFYFVLFYLVKTILDILTGKLKAKSFFFFFWL